MDKELLDILQGKDETTEPKKEFKEITLKFGKGCVGDEFQGKDGNSYRQIMIPPNEEVKQPWQTFVVKANQVHENQYGKGMWCKLPADGSTTVTKSVAKGVDEQGKTIWLSALSRPCAASRCPLRSSGSLRFRCLRNLPPTRTV